MISLLLSGLSVQVIESFSTLHLVMECASEGDLQARIAKEGPLTEDRARHIFAQVTAAIHHMVGTGRHAELH